MISFKCSFIKESYKYIICPDHLIPDIYSTSIYLIDTNNRSFCVRVDVLQSIQNSIMLWCTNNNDVHHIWLELIAVQWTTAVEKLKTETKAESVKEDLDNSMVFQIWCVVILAAYPE